MPNRIIKESICTSEEIDHLTPEQEVFFYRLMVNVDDYGLLDARPKILASKCFPLKSVDTKKIEAWLQALAGVGLINRYEVEGLPYLAIAKWAQHQQIRAKRPKYPAPESGSAIICNQVQANVPVIQSNPIQSESNLNPNTKAKRTVKPFSGKPVDVSEEVWASFVAVRNKKRAAITDLAMLGIRQEAVKAGIELEQALTICCERGWAGFKAEWMANDAGARGSPARPNANAALFASMTHLHQQPQRQPEEHHGRTIDSTPLLG